MRRAEQRHSPRRIAKPRELSWLLPQFGTISMNEDGGKRRVFAHKISVTGARRPDLPPWRQQIREGRKGRAHRQGLAQRHNIAKKSDRRINRASSDAGPELAGRESHAAMGSPKALIAPLKSGMGGLTGIQGDLTSRHQTTGRVRVFAAANTWRT